MAQKRSPTDSISGIRSRLIMLALLCLLPMALLLLNVANENRRITSQQAIDNLATYLNLIDDDFDDTVYSASQLLASLSLSPEQWLAPSKQCNQRFFNLNSQYSQYSNIYSVALNGDIVCSATNNDLTASLADRKYIQEALAGKPLAVGAATLGRLSKKVIMPVAAPLTNSFGEVIGVIAVSIGLDDLLNEQHTLFDMQRSDLGNITTTLWQTDGTVLARVPDTIAITGKIAKDSVLFKTLIENLGSHKTIEVKGLDDQSRWYAFTQIGDRDSELVMSAGLPTKELFASADEVYEHTIIVLISASVLILLGSWLLAEIAVRRPVSRLATLAEQVSEGKRGIRVGRIYGADELVTLGKSFDEMVSYLEKNEREQEITQQELQQAKQDLEGKVLERTLAVETASRQAIQRAELLEQQRLEIIIMNELTDMLQACHTLDDSWPVIGRSLENLFGHSFGAIYTYRDSGNALVTGVRWGESDNNHFDTFSPEDCWALRLGRAWFYEADSRHPPCEHLGEGHSSDYICVPMLADGKTLGVLHIELQGDDMTEQATAELAQAVAGRLALALSNIKLRQTLRNLSMRDVLTGLYNRRFVDEVFENEIARCQRNGKSLSVLMIDVDHFKFFNDTYGHEAGDVVLKAMGGLLKQHFRKTDLPCRLGGEEFLVILPECDSDAAMMLAEALRQKVANLALVHKGKSLSTVTASIGIASWPVPFDDETLLFNAADAALYAAKNAGRNQVRLAQFPGTEAED